MTNTVAGSQHLVAGCDLGLDPLFARLRVVYRLRWNELGIDDFVTCHIQFSQEG